MYGIQIPYSDTAADDTMTQPGSGIIVGVEAIGRVFGRSRSTIYRWIANEGLPCAKLPSGHWAITPSLIDSWLLARNRAWHEQRKLAKQIDGTH